MPTYSYHCRDCDARFDAMRRMAERKDAPPCPACASPRTELAISAPFVTGHSTSSAGASCCGGSSGVG